MMFLWAQGCWAQYWDFEQPDYSKIEGAVKNRASEMYYPKLLERFQQADATLGLSELRHLYYGFVFHPDYKADKSAQVKDSLEVILQKETHSEEDLKQIVSFSEKILDKYPFEINTMNYQLYALEHLGDTTAYKEVSFQMEMIFETMLSSGDGASKASAFYVIDPAHELILMEALGLRSEDNPQAMGKYDFLELAANDIGLEGLYFDLSPYRNIILHSLSNHNL